MRISTAEKTRIPPPEDAVIRFAIVLAALGLGQSALPAHDLWLIPPEKAKAEESAKILAISGMEFPKSEHAPDPANSPSGGCSIRKARRAFSKPLAPKANPGI